MHAEILDVSSLYNDYAQPLGMWAECLRIIHYAGSAAADPATVRTLWDHALLKVGLK